MYIYQHNAVSLLIPVTSNLVFRFLFFLPPVHLRASDSTQNHHLFSLPQFALFNATKDSHQHDPRAAQLAI